MLPKEGQRREDLYRSVGEVDCAPEIRCADALKR